MPQKGGHVMLCMWHLPRQTTSKIQYIGTCKSQLKITINKHLLCQARKKYNDVGAGIWKESFPFDC